MEGQPGRGRMCGRFESRWTAHREAARDYLFDRMVFVETLKDATVLWEQQPCATPDGPISRDTRRRNFGCSRGGHRWTGQCNGGLAAAASRGASLGFPERLADGIRSKKASSDSERLQAQGQELREQSRQLGESLRDAEMQGLSLRKDEAGLQHVLGDLTLRIETLMSDTQRGVSGWAAA